MNGPCLKDLDQASVGSPICLASYGYHDKAGGCAFVEQRDRKGKTGMTGGLPGRGFSNKSMLICIQRWKGGEPYGIAAHPDCEKSVPFQGLAELCLAIDGIASFPERRCRKSSCWNCLRGSIKASREGSVGDQLAESIYTFAVHWS